MNDQNKAAFNLPYSLIKQVGDFYFISGHLGVDISTASASNDIKEQTKKVFSNFANSMSLFDLNIGDIVKTTIFLTDMSDFMAVNEVYATYFVDDKPARSTVAVRELPRIAGDIQLKVEIEAIAYKKS